MSPDFTKIINAAEELLSEKSDESVQIIDVEQISESDRRSLLLRIILAPNSDSLPTQLIIKQVVSDQYDPDDLESFDTHCFFGDWVGAQFLSELPDDPGHGPRFFGGDRSLGFIILEDMGTEHQSLVEPLLNGDAVFAETMLIRFAERLGQMHADTLGMVDEFRKLQNVLHPNLAASAAPSFFGQLKVDKILENLAILGNKPNPDSEKELRVVERVVANPGPFTAYIHYDPCPDNFFVQEDELRIMDFEFGQIGHALIDILYARMVFPSCWCCNRLPKKLVVRMEERYRATLASTCTVAQDASRFYKELTTICGYWMANMFQWNVEDLLKEDQEWGIATTHPRVLSRLNVFIETSEEFDHLPALRNLATEVRKRLQDEWPEAEPLPLYPAFR